MTSSNQPAKDKILKTDALGRVRTPADRREAILDEFERSGMPGTRFAKRHGINYQTFASWIQKRRRGRGEYEKPATAGEPEPATPALTLAEVFVEAPSPGPGDDAGESSLRVELPGGAVIEIGDAGGAALAAELIRALAPAH